MTVNARITSPSHIQIQASVHVRVREHSQAEEFFQAIVFYYSSSILHRC
jgi:hypothetical protein